MQNRIAAARAVLFVFVVVALGGAGHFATAQTYPTPGGSPLPPPRIQLPPSTVEPATPPAAVEAPKPGSEAPPGADQIETDIIDIKIEGGTVYPPDELRGIVAPLIGKKLPVSKVFEAAQEITRRYREDGYILSQAIVPEQRVSNGRFTIRIVEGYITEVVLQGEVGPVEDLIKRFLGHIPGKKPANIDEIERYMLLVRDIPGITVTGLFRAAPGASGARQMVVQVDRKGFGGLFSYDNRGSYFFGPGEGTANVHFDSHTSSGERIDFLFYNTMSFNKPYLIRNVDSTDEQRYGQIMLTGFIGDDGLSYKVYAGMGPANPGRSNETVHAKFKTAAAALTYPVIRSRALNFSVTGQIETADSDIQSGGRTQQAHLRIVRGLFSGDMTDSWGGFNVANFGVHQGINGLDASPRYSQQPPNLPNQRIGARSDFLKLTMDLSRTQHIASTDWGDFNFLLSGIGQFTTSKLFSLEQFKGGGFSWGRGYWPGRIIQDVPGDHGLAGSAELRWNPSYVFPFVDITWEPQFYAFYDIARVWSKDAEKPPIDRTDSTASTGFGLRTALFEKIQSEFEVAHPLTIFTYKGVSGEPNHKPLAEFYFRFIYSF